MIKQLSIGVISKVFPSKIVVEVPDPTKLNHNYQGEFYEFAGINAFITIYQSETEKYIYQVINLYEQEKPLLKEEEQSKFQNTAFIEAVPIGEISEDGFEFGLAHFPLINDDVYLTINSDLDSILKLHEVKLTMNLGGMSTHPNYFPLLSVDNLFSNHTSILGNTGSGKSTTTRKMISEIINQKENIDMDKVNFLIFDVHDEYNEIPFEYLKKVDINNISIPLDKLIREDWINLVRPAEGVQLPVLLQGLRIGNLIESDQITEDIFKVFCAIELYNNVQTDAVAKRSKIISLLNGIVEFDEIMRHFTRFGSFDGNNNNKEEEFKRTVNDFLQENYEQSYLESQIKIPELIQATTLSIQKLASLEIGIEFALLLEESKGNNQARSHCGTLLIRIENLISMYSNTLFDENEGKLDCFEETMKMKKGFTVFQFSEVIDEDLLFFTSFILRIIYDEQRVMRQRDNKTTRLVHFVFDEAHMYITENIKSNNTGSIDMFEKIAKVGRKFGVFMILASQRPSELSKTVLSQCNNFILHRIRNNMDLEQMRSSIPYISDAQLLRLSYLKTGSALLVGEAFPIPLELIIDGEEYSGESETLVPTTAWRL